MTYVLASNVVPDEPALERSHVERPQNLRDVLSRLERCPRRAGDPLATVSAVLPWPVLRKSRELRNISATTALERTGTQEPFSKCQHPPSSPFSRTAGAAALLKLARSQPRCQTSQTSQTLQPFGYTITLGSGNLAIESDSTKSNEITGGQFQNGEIELPTSAVTAPGADPVLVSYETLDVASDLDLSGEVDIVVGTEMEWGELARSTAPSPLEAYSLHWLNGPGEGHVYFSADYTAAFWPLDPNDDFKSPALSSPPTPAQLAGQLMQGLTVLLNDAALCKILTPDGPGSGEVKRQKR